MDKKFSNIVLASEQAMSIKYNTIVYNLQRQGKKVTVMSLGEAFFDIPLFPMDSLPIPQVFHYSHSMGTPELREKLAEFFLKKYEIPINYEKEILVTTGSKAAIHFALMSILNPGDEVLIPEPAWVSYPEQVKLCYAKPVNIPYYKTIYEYGNFVTSKTKALIICNPHNPSGKVFNEEEIKYLIDFAEKHNIWLLSDEAYSEFIKDQSFVSPGKFDREKKHTIIFNSISKNYGISGWRLGYVIANEEVIYNVLKINQHLITCPATILELYVEKYFYDILDITKPQIESLLEKRAKLAAFMTEIGLKYLEGDGTFYFFVSIFPSNLSSEEFTTKLLFEHYISVVPGIGYGDSCDKFVRISIGTAALEENRDALIKIKQLIEQSSNFETNLNKEVLVVAGGVWQKPFIQYLKDKGHIVTVVDPFLYSEGVMIADKHIKADVKDVETIFAEIKDKKYDFIATDQSDISVNTVAILSEQLNLNANLFQVTNTFVNKYEMRMLSQKLGIGIPAFAKIYSVADINIFIEKVGLPIILKPADSQSSRGVSMITSENINSLEHFFVESLRFANCGYILAEKFIEGKEITVEGIASNYKHKNLALSQKKHFRMSVASQLEYPAEIPDSVLRLIERNNDIFVENSGLRFGITHAEYIIEKASGTPYLVEIACRGGGTLISSDIVNWVSGQNVYELFYSNLQGQITDVKSIEPQKRNAILYFFEFQKGKVKSISGIQNALKIEGVNKLKLFFKKGDTLKDAEDDRSRQGFVIIYANSKQELECRLETVKKLIKVEYE